MVGLFTNCNILNDDGILKKRKAEEVKQGNLMEEKKLRVEQLVTALSNVETKRKQRDKRLLQKKTSPISSKEVTCVCSANVCSVDSSSSSPLYSNTSSPLSANVTFDVNSKISEGHKKLTQINHKLTAIKTDPPFFHHFIPMRGIHPCHPEVGNIANVVPVTNQTIAYFPVLRENVVTANKPTDLKTPAIVRVPRDNKTPLVVFKPGLYPGDQVAAFHFPTSLPGNVSNPVPQLEHKHSSTKEDSFLVQNVHKRHVSVVKKKEEPIKHLSKKRQFLDTRNDDLSKYPNRLSMWSIDDVHNYFKDTDCAEYANIFKLQEIDGKALQLLDEISISRLLHVKMGPAIKLSALIKILINKIVE